MLAKTVLAIHRLLAGRVEGYLGLLAAVSAGHAVHLAVGPLLLLEVLAAVGATAGLVLEALLLVEFLLAGGEGEFFPAVLAGQVLVRETHVSPWVVWVVGDQAPANNKPRLVVYDKTGS